MYKRTDHLTREVTYVSEKPKTDTESLDYFEEVKEPVREKTKSLIEIIKHNKYYLKKKQWKN